MPLALGSLDPNPQLEGYSYVNLYLTANVGGAREPFNDPGGVSRYQYANTRFQRVAGVTEGVSGERTS